MAKMQEVWRIADLLQRATSLLTGAGIDNPRLEAELLLSYCLSRSRTELYLLATQKVHGRQLDHCLETLSRRCRREPLAYITGEREFWSYSFEVSPAVLVPRPETEILIESVIACKGSLSGGGKCLDLCCGSGIIAIVLAKELGVEVIGVDISREALEVCRQNCLKLGVEEKVSLVQADLGTSFRPTGQFPLITANPPYIRSAELVSGLAPEVADFEPRLALDGGRDGLDLVRKIVKSLPGLLAPGGHFFMEIGADQGPKVIKLLEAPGTAGSWDTIDIVRDYADRDRLVMVKRKR